MNRGNELEYMREREGTYFLLKTGILFLLYLGISFFFYQYFKEVLYKNMLWNVFLAILPLLFASIMWTYARRWGYIRQGIFGVLWLLFFPNAPYMITDIIHISGDSFFLNRVEYSQLEHSTNMILWIRIAYIGIGMLIGVLAGMLSLRMVHELLKRRLGSLASHIALLIICVLSGYGIYLGRFLRLNSWNLIHFHWFLIKLKDMTPIFAFKFTLLYAFFVYIIYLVFCIFYPRFKDAHGMES